MVNPKSTAARVKTGRKCHPDVIAPGFRGTQGVITLRQRCSVSWRPASIKVLAAGGPAHRWPAGQHRSALVQFQQPLALSVRSLNVCALGLELKCLSLQPRQQLFARPSLARWNWFRNSLLWCWLRLTIRRNELRFRSAATRAQAQYQQGQSCPVPHVLVHGD